MEKKDSSWIYFVLGIIIGAVFFVGIYGFRVLDFTYDEWLLTGKDLQQHYVGWKYFRNADWSFPIGLHDGLTYPYQVGILYTDSIPLFAIFFKILSPILPETFQYFGLFGLMCYILNGGMASLLIARFNKNKVFCALGSVFFVLSTPVLQRLFGLLSEDSRHTSLAAHFVILAAIGIWMYREKFQKYWKAAVAFSILGILCVMIQMYMIFIVGGIMCVYLLHCILKEKDWKRFFVVFSCFAISSVLAFYLMGGFTDVLTAMAGGFGLYSANLNALINPFNYSTFFGKLPWNPGQYEGFSYVGLGMFVLYGVCGVILLIKAIQIRNWKDIKRRCRDVFKRHKNGIIPLAVVTIVFWSLALTSSVYWGKRIVLQVFLPERWMDMLAIIRSSGRFMWVIMYFVMLFGLFLLTRHVKKKKIQIAVLVFCVVVQLCDLMAPIRDIHNQYTSESIEEDIYAKDDFWEKKLGDYKHIVYFPLGSCPTYQMLQIGTKASYFDIDNNYFYMSRYYTEKLTKKEDARNKKVFENNQLADDTVYILNYVNAHKYKDRCNLYMVDGMIVALKNPVEGLKPYNDVYVSMDNPLLELDFTYNGLGKAFAHSGWNLAEYGEAGMWTTEQSVVRIYSGGAKHVRITIDYEGGKKKGTTDIKMNGIKKAEINNKESGTVEFETKVKTTTNASKRKGVNWLFFNTGDSYSDKNQGKEVRAVMIKKITIAYVD